MRRTRIRLVQAGLLTLGTLAGSPRVLGQAPAGRPPEHRRGIEQRDESQVVNITRCERVAHPRVCFVISGQVFHPASGARKDREAAIRMCRDTIAWYRRRGSKGGVAEIEKRLKAMTDGPPPRFTHLSITVVPGADRPPIAKWTETDFLGGATIPISAPAGGVGEYTAELPFAKEPGRYTVILQPFDNTRPDGVPVYGGCDTITVTVEGRAGSGAAKGSPPQRKR